MLAGFSTQCALLALLHLGGIDPPPLLCCGPLATQMATGPWKGRKANVETHVKPNIHVPLG